MKQKSVNDFMDHEDINEFGIAPKRLKVNDEFISDKLATNAKLNTDVIERHIQVNPVDLGIRLLRRLGVRDGKGVGANVERELNIGKETPEENGNDATIAKVYTCARPPPEFQLLTESDVIEPDVMRKFKLAPDDIASFIVRNPKSDRKGLGYVGLNPQNFVGTEGSGFESRSVTGMSGQAFGVGAFEDDDDDIYAQENLNDYDFELGPSRPSDRRDANKVGIGVAEGFVKASKEFKFTAISGPKLPKNYQPSVPKSVLDSCSNSRDREPEVEKKPLVFAGVRSDKGIMEPIVGSAVQREPISSETGPSKDSVLVQGGGAISTQTEKLEWRVNSSEKEFKPSILPTNSRFVSAGKLDTLSNRVVEQEKIETPREKAARMKMYGKLTRSVMPYRFASIVCKRFNVKLTAENSYEPKANDQTVKNMFGRGILDQPIFEFKSREVHKSLQYGTSNKGDAGDDDKQGSSKDRHKSLHDRTIQKSNFLAFLNDSDLPESRTREQEAIEIKRVEQPNVDSRENSVHTLIGKQLIDSSNVGPVQDLSKAKSEENADCEALDSLKNLNLLLDVFGDDDDDDAEVHDVFDETDNGSEHLNNSTSDKHMAISVNERSSDDRPRVIKQVVPYSAEIGHSRTQNTFREDQDCFSKFFEVRGTESTKPSFNNVNSESVSSAAAKCAVKEEASVISSVDSEEEFGPCLPPAPNPSNDYVTSEISSVLMQNVKQEVECDSNSSKVAVDVLFVEKICSELKHKKKKKEKKHKKSKKS